MKKCSRSTLAWASSLAILLFALPAQAQDEGLPTAAELSTQCAPGVETNRRASLSHNEDEGFWFHGDVSRCLLQRYSLLAPFADRVHLLEQRLQLQGERDALQERRVALAVQEAAVAVEALEAAVRRAREAEESRDAWYRHPAFWFVTGAVVVIVLEIVAVWAFQQLPP